MRKIRSDKKYDLIKQGIQQLKQLITHYSGSEARSIQNESI